MFCIWYYAVFCCKNRAVVAPLIRIVSNSSNILGWVEVWASINIFLILSTLIIVLTLSERPTWVSIPSISLYCPWSARSGRLLAYLVQYYIKQREVGSFPLIFSKGTCQGHHSCNICRVSKRKVPSHSYQQSDPSPRSQNRIRHFASGSQPAKCLNWYGRFEPVWYLLVAEKVGYGLHFSLGRSG